MRIGGGFALVRRAESVGRAKDDCAEVTDFSDGSGDAGVILSAFF